MATSSRLTAVLVVALLLLAALVGPGDCRRRAGGGGSRSRSTSTRLRDRISNVFKGKNSGTAPKNPQSSYPKQTWSQSGVPQQPGVGGGGWVNPNQKQTGFGGYGTNTKGGYGNNYNYGSNRGGYGNNYNYGGNRGGYGNQYNYGGNKFGGSYIPGFGGGYGHGYGRSGLFGGGSRSFAVGAGAGFLGGAVAGATAMSAFHLYRQYQAMMYYKYSMQGMHGGYDGFGSFGGYGGGLGPGYGYGYQGRGMLANTYDCVSGCPNQAFCDYGICRCREGYEARFGSCWKNFEVDGPKRESELKARLETSFVYQSPCSKSADCWKVDMNLVCSTNTSKCECRRDMKWNNELGECQIFMDVDCTIVDPKVMPSEAKATTTTSTTASTTTVEETTYPPGFNETEYDDEDDGFHNETIDDPPTLDDTILNGRNLTDLTAKETLKNSTLLSLDVNKTSAEDIKTAFCQEIGSLASRYEASVNTYDDVYVSRDRAVDVALSAGTIVLIVTVLCCCCGCLCLCICLKKIKEVVSGAFGSGVRGKTNDNFTPPMTMGNFGMENITAAQPQQPAYSDNGYMPPAYHPQPMYPPAGPNDPYNPQPAFNPQAPAYPPQHAPAYPPPYPIT